ncbi:MAG: hypothetical protein RMX97_24505 [Nostoc sp. DedQUE11]|nr:hypothetical protein [Nostoc sp. DedQUE11]
MIYIHILNPACSDIPSSQIFNFKLRENLLKKIISGKKRISSETTKDNEA